MILLLHGALVVAARPAAPDCLVVFYNLENLFDPDDDAATQDEDFTPAGRYGWTWKKVNRKCNGIAKTIIAIGAGNAPTLVGVCEVENRRVLNKLIRDTPLAKIGYEVVHRDSPDPRGIDVALLYRPDNFTVLHAGWLKVKYEQGSTRTREILYAKGVLNDLDTLHVFVNHWPSKFGGALQTEPKRMSAAATLRTATDSIFAANPFANILIMGDFNDTPDSNPVKNGLQAASDTCCPACLHNLMAPIAVRGGGTLKYRKDWEVIDMFLVSGNLLDTLQPVYCVPSAAKIYDAGFLLEPDENYLGNKPLRTYYGGKYKGGVSDHLPIVMTIKRNY